MACSPGPERGTSGGPGSGNENIPKPRRGGSRPIRHRLAAAPPGLEDFWASLPGAAARSSLWPRATRLSLSKALFLQQPSSLTTSTSATCSRSRMLPAPALSRSEPRTCCPRASARSSSAHCASTTSYWHQGACSHRACRFQSPYPTNLKSISFAAERGWCSPAASAVPCMPW